MGCGEIPVEENEISDEPALTQEQEPEQVESNNEAEDDSVQEQNIQQEEPTDTKEQDNDIEEQASSQATMRSEPSSDLEECMRDGIYGVIKHTTIKGDQRRIAAYGGDEYDGEIYLYYKYNDKLFLKTTELYGFIDEIYTYFQGNVATYYDSVKNCHIYDNGYPIEVSGPNIYKYYIYESIGNPAEIHTHDGVSESCVYYTYENGQCVYEKCIKDDLLQYEANYIYDGNGYLIEKDEHTIYYKHNSTEIHSENNAQIFYYNDENGNPLEVKGGNKHDFYTYYDNGQVKTKKDCLSRIDPPSHEIEYDINGNMTLYRDNHQDSSVDYDKIDVKDTVYKYDDMNRVISTEEYENGEFKAGYYCEYQEIPQEKIDQLVPKLIDVITTDYPRIILEGFIVGYDSLI